MRKIALWVLFVTIGLWGIGLYLFPAFLWETLGGADPVAGTYSRYSGAWFLGVTFVAWLALRDGTGARPVLTLSVIGGALSFVTLLIDVLNETNPAPNTWLLWLAIIDAAAIAVLGAMALREDLAAPSSAAASGSPG